MRDAAGTARRSGTGHGEQPLTARSVLASTLLGTDPPRMPADRLVRVGSLFGLSEGTVRTALSRMVTAGELTRDGDGRYVLAGHLVERQHRLMASRHPPPAGWSGRWIQAVVESGARPASERAELRRAMARLRLAELRDGVWLRPDNLDPEREPAARSIVEGSCRWFSVWPDHDEDLAGVLWDLGGWADRARDLRREMAATVERLDRGDTAALAPGFVLSAAVLRHFVADPVLPTELLPRRWPGAALRADYDRFDRSYRDLLAGWLRADAG